MRRATALIVLPLAMVAGPIDSASADAPQVTVVSPGGAQHTLALEALAGGEDVVGRTYALRSAGGESARTVTGFSIAALLEAAGIDPYGFSYLEVERPGGGAVQLSRDQAVESGAFPEGPPVVYPTPAGTGFLRPGAGSEDDNAADSFESPAGLTIALRKGASLQVRAEAAPRRTTPGEMVHFHAVVERAGSGEALTWSWYFDDGESGEGESVAHAFAKPGSYSVVVGVKAAGEETGASAVVRIQVGKPPAGGPDRKGGGADRAVGAPDHGAADGPSGSASPVPAEAPPAVPTPAPTPTHAPRSKPEKAVAPAQERHREPTPEPPGEEVTGELLDATAAPRTASTPRPTSPAAARTGSSQPDGSGGGVPAAAWGLGAVVALLGFGALVEAGAFTDLIPRTVERLR